MQHLNNFNTFQQPGFDKESDDDNEEEDEEGEEEDEEDDDDDVSSVTFDEPEYWHEMMTPGYLCKGFFLSFTVRQETVKAIRGLDIHQVRGNKQTLLCLYSVATHEQKGFHLNFDQFPPGFKDFKINSLKNFECFGQFCDIN